MGVVFVFRCFRGGSKSGKMSRMKRGQRQYDKYFVSVLDERGSSFDDA